MPRGEKSSYTAKQKRMARHIEEGYEKRGVPGKESARRAWATVNKETGGGKQRAPKRTTKSKSERSTTTAAKRTTKARSPKRGTTAKKTTRTRAKSRA